MNYILLLGLFLLLAAVVASSSLAWQLLKQNGRMLLRIESLEKRIEEMPLGEATDPAAASEGAGSAATSDDERGARFTNRSLANSKLKRDGLKAGTVAPEFRLPRLDGGELSLSDLRGRKVLLVFSSPHCGPCNVLAPKLQKFYRKQAGGRFFAWFRSRPRPLTPSFVNRLRHKHYGGQESTSEGRPNLSPSEGEREKPPAVEVVMISKGEPDENREKIKEHGLTFPVVLQKQWEISRLYAFFGTPVGYLIDETGVLIADAAIGVDGILDLMNRAKGIVANGESRKHKVEIQNPTESSETEPLPV